MPAFALVPQPIKPNQRLAAAVLFHHIPCVPAAVSNWPP